MMSIRWSRHMRRMAPCVNVGLAIAWLVLLGGSAFSSSGHERERAFEPIPGPIDRASYFSEQRRRQRETWRLAWLCTLTALVAVIPLSLLVTAFLNALAVLITKGVSLLVPIPAAVPHLFRLIAVFAALPILTIGALLDWSELHDTIARIPLTWLGTVRERPSYEIRCRDRMGRTPWRLAD